MNRDYTQVVMDGTFFTLSGWFFFFMPIRVPYGKIIQKALEAGYVVKGYDSGRFVPTLEKGVSFGRGWIGIEIDAANITEPPKHVKRVEGNFTATEHVGSYKDLGNAYQEIMKDHADTSEYYNLYLNAPGEVPESKLKTMVIFR